MITQTTNLDYLLDGLRLHYGDYDGSLYSEAIYRTALVNGVKYLSKRWNAKYYIDEDNNIARNEDIVFRLTTPLILPEDEYAIILAATVILRQVALTSSADSFTSWSTPDLSVSSGSKERTYTKLYETALSELNSYFAKGLAKSIKRFMLIESSRTYPVSPGQIDLTPGVVENN